MIRYMIASDLHGSSYYGQMLFERFEEERPLKLLLLGDLLYHGARNDLPEKYDTRALTAVLNRYKDHILAVRGNCDSEIDQTVLEFPIMSDYLELFADGRVFVMTHGHIFDEHSMIPHTRGTVLLHGHTHVGVMERCSDFYFMNPGSVALPKDGPIHTYMTYEGGMFSLKNVENGHVLRTFELTF